MDIRIDIIRISGFRGISDLEISLPRVTILIGPNNSGKTSVIKAMQLAIGDYSRYISADDFYISNDGSRVEEILIDLRIIPVVDNKKVQVFKQVWASEFGSKIQQEVNGQQYVAIRTKVKENLVKGGYDCLRYSLASWPDKNEWKTIKLKETKFYGRIDSVPFIGIEAQRDLYSELKDRSSFVSKILSSIQYKEDDKIKLEDLIEQLNLDAVSRSPELISFKNHLENLNSSFGRSGCTEITPFPKKIRDLSKNFSIHFGNNSNNMFSMEYHGMGTRSWASMLTLKSFIELISEQFKLDSKPFFPIMAAEEPEAHLHPNAQKTLYKQLADINGQIIVSTHSPYIAAMSDPFNIRALNISESGCHIMQISSLDDEDMRKLKREVIHSRGDVLFSKAIVLCEGETEEQALPLLFERYFSKTTAELDLSFIGVGGSGKRYKPFLTLAHDLKIPVFIFSDGEPDARRGLTKTWKDVFDEDIDLNNCPFITFLDDTDFEGYLLKSGFESSIENAIIKTEDSSFIIRWIEEKDNTVKKRVPSILPKCSSCNQQIYEDIIRDYTSGNGKTNAILDILDNGKTKYAPAIAEELCKLEIHQFPIKISEFFDKIKKGVYNA